MKSLKLPCLRGRIGDWMYYVSVMKFSEIANRTSMVPEIHNNEELSRWIQREVSNRSEEITNYIKYQDQRFFNSIIFGLYGGSPKWQEIDFLGENDKYSEDEIEYFGKTFGVLTLDGNEKIFAIDGQHRTKAIMDISKESPKFANEEVSVIFVAHKKSPEGEIRTRRLFSTLNRYAVPVTISEIIALDEEDNAAIITRKLMEESDLFKNKILYSKNRSLNPNNKTAFTNIIILYDIVNILLTDKKVISYEMLGYKADAFTRRRAAEEVINKDVNNLIILFEKTFKKIPSLRRFFYQDEPVDRINKKTSLLFRPIGQIIMFTVLKIAKQENKFNEALKYFAKDNFNLKNKIWNQVFWDQELGTIKPEKSLQTFAIQVILLHLDISLKLSPKDSLVFKNFNIDHKTI